METNNLPSEVASPVAQTEKKSNKGMLVATILFAILAIGGIGFGAWAMVDGNSKKAQSDTQISALKQQINDLVGKEVYNNEEIATNNETVISEKVVDNYLAQSLISPYLVSFNYASDIFDYDFTEDAKINIAYLNSECYSYSNMSVSYDCINKEYQELFGNDSSLAKKDYAARHTNSYEFVKGDYGDSSDSFRIIDFNGGGAGFGVFDVVKSAIVVGDNVVVEVYHGGVPICEAVEDDYCIETNGGSSFKIDSIEEYNVKELIEKYSNKISVYKMTFVKNNGHYVLSAVEKK